MAASVSDEVDKLVRQFRGRITDSETDKVGQPTHLMTDIKGGHIVLYPAPGDGDSDVITAVRLASLCGARTMVRSGNHPASDGGEDGTGAVVINLKHFDEISFTKATVRVGAAVTTAQLAHKLVEQQLFLPLDETPKSVLSNALSRGLGCFGLSVGELGDRVVCLEGVAAGGRRFKASKNGTQEEQQSFKSIMRGTTRAIVTRFEMEALTKAEAEHIHLQQLHFPYEPVVFSVVLETVFAEWPLPEKVDVMVRAYASRYGPLAFVSAASNDLEAQKQLKAWMVSLRKRLAKLDPPLPEEHPGVQFAERQGAGTLELAVGASVGTLYKCDQKRCRKTVKVGDLQDFLALDGDYSTTVSKALSSHSMRASTTVQLCGRQETAASISLFTPGSEADAESAAAEQMLQFMKPEAEQEQPAKRRRLSPLSAFLSEAKEGRQHALDALQKLVETRRAAECPIPGFSGWVFQSDATSFCLSAAYKVAIYQYASSSYPGYARMKPLMVAYPRSVEDVKSAVKYAVKKGLKVVARSGGHQYCGLSSGGQDTVLLSMDHLSEATVVEECTSDGKDCISISTLGPGSKLTNLASVLKDNHVCLPHGECPFVCIGGHVQTGGYGHIQRSFGLNLDHVLSFDIVTADGELRTIRRPGKSGQGDENDRIYWGVLGGGPGSFGIVTQIRHLCIRDDKHPNSAGYSQPIVYEKKALLAVMREVMRYTQYIQEAAAAGTEENEAIAGKDMFFTVISGPLLTPLPPAILLEMVDGNPGGPSEEVPEHPFSDVVGRIDEARSPWHWIPDKLVEFFRAGFDGRKALSEMNNSFVRRILIPDLGREFPLPYKKRLNCTRFALKEAFIVDFVDLVDTVLSDDGVKFVSQMNMGGGRYRDPKVGAEMTSIAHRDSVFNLVFDVFYKPGHESTAKKYQDKMEELLRKHWYGDGPCSNHEEEIRMLWGSFGDTCMSEEKIQDYYYGDQGRYKDLQKLKQRVDANDTFHTEFTVQLPREKQASA